MKINKEYRIPVSVSDESFVDKTISGAMIGTNTKENVEIRKKYGFKGNSTIHFRQTEVTPNECLNLLKKGHSMCNIFEYNKDKKTFFYTLHLMDGDCVNIAEEYIHPLYSYIVVDSETGNVMYVFDREQKPFAS